MVLELLERNAAFRLEANIEDDHVVANLENLALHDLALVDRRERTVVELHHLLVFGRRVFVLVVQLRPTVHERAKLRALRVALFARCDRAGWGLELRHTEEDSPYVAGV